jgi:hypothetical protein
MARMDRSLEVAPLLIARDGWGLITTTYIDTLPNQRSLDARCIVSNESYSLDCNAQSLQPGCCAEFRGFPAATKDLAWAAGGRAVRCVSPSSISFSDPCRRVKSRRTLSSLSPVEVGVRKRKRAVKIGGGGVPRVPARQQQHRACGVGVAVLIIVPSSTAASRACTRFLCQHSYRTVPYRVARRIVHTAQTDSVHTVQLSFAPRIVLHCTHTVYTHAVHTRHRS